MATRFCPSPTGYLHLGNIRTALFNRLLGYKHRMEFLLRIEDTDQTRCKPEFATALLEDLKWMGLHWDQQPVKQSDRRELYSQYLDQLKQQGDIYPCFCSDESLKLERDRQLATGRPPKYSRKCLNLDPAKVQQLLAQGAPHAWRFKIPSNQKINMQDLIRGAWSIQSNTISDFVILRRDGEPTFLFVNALDDALMGISHAMRGEDHLPNTPKQLLLLQALGCKPPLYGHLSMIIDGNKQPLSKRNQSFSIRVLREQGYRPIAIANYLFRLGHPVKTKDLLSLDEMAQNLLEDGLSKSAVRYTEDQLKAWQKTTLSSMPTSDLTTLLQPYMNRLPNQIPAAELATCLSKNILFPEESALWIERFFTDPLVQNPEGQAIIKEAGSAFFRMAIELWPQADGNWPKFTAELESLSSHKGRRLYMPLRIALCGQSKGPELEAMAKLLGRERVGQRLQQAASNLA